MELLTINETAKRLGCSRSQLYTLMRQGRLPIKPYPTVSRTRFSSEDIDKWRKEQIAIRDSEGGTAD